MNLPLIRALTLGLLFLIPAWLQAQQKPSQKPAAKIPAAKIIVTISVDWEGRDIGNRNLKAYQEFRKRFPKIPLTHFINAAYYLRDEKPESVTQKIRSVILEGDETGLHIHCWKSLVEKSGVKYKAMPTFWAADRPARKGANGDEGHEVEMAAYSADEVEKMAKTSRKILEDHGFKISDSFRAAGWVASKEVLLGIAKAGFKVDSSATDRKWHEEELAKYSIYKRIGELWPKVTQHTQPFEIKTQAGTLLEMPDTGALADYVKADEMDIHLKEALDKAKEGQVRFVHIGFHQETAARYLSRVEKCVAKWEGVEGVEFQTLEKAASHFRKLQKSKAGKGK